MPRTHVIGLPEFERDLLAVLTPATVHRRFVEKKGKIVIDRLIASAKAGIGPGNTKYAAYEESYKEHLGLRPRTGRGGRWTPKRAGAFLATGKGGKGRLHKAIAAGNKLWLLLTGTMLAKTNFAWEQPQGTGLTLVWTAPDEQTGIYAEVHNYGAKPIGRGGPRKKREFMHFESSVTLRAVEEAYRQAIDELAAAFSAGHAIR